MGGCFPGMDELEAFLMQDEEAAPLSFPPAIAESGNNGKSRISFDDLWVLQPQEAQRFDELRQVSDQGDQLRYVEQQQQEEMEELEEDEEELETGGDDKKKNKGSRSRNLIFERNRRKRLNQQLMTLRSLVPNITKMDKRSILVDAQAYLQNVLQETEKELEKTSLSSSSTASSGESSSITLEDDETPPLMEASTKGYDRNAALPTISKIEAYMMEKERFLLKIRCNKAMGAMGLVQRAIEMLGLQITCSSIDELDHANMLITTFLRVKKKEGVTQEKLLHQVRTNAGKLGLVLHHEDS
ncbi:transcription factor bHLH35-like isoform X2 [Macadamia integrifolia]|uniref:transcription factor bHLH35-like isoform X2 n=1 Tax=Macadamia integrifolia TaxID=60698 RepID=UPI001C4E6FE4|nr:transcription factor bHLH35-like isoform X2 [Macadamia integrifolia]